MKLQVLISALVVMHFLVRCKSKEEKPTTIQNTTITIPQANQSPPDLVTYIAANSIYGEWVYIGNDYYSKLIINKDGTFQNFTENDLKKSIAGTWTNNDSEYVLLNTTKLNETSNLKSKTHHCQRKENSDFKMALFMK